jgi:hypothetical protein
MEALQKEADVATLNVFVDEVSRILRDAEAIDETAPEISAGNN